ncbi:MAG: DUF4325 domain-containing protein [Cyanobacteria bacterium P01_C01_bin.69]
MSQSSNEEKLIRRFILHYVDQYPTSIAQAASIEFNIDQQIVNEHLNTLVREELLQVDGENKHQVYELNTTDWDKSFDITPETAEDIIWDNEITPLLKDTSRDAIDIWNHGFTEMFNNAIDHSEGTAITVHVSISAIATEISLDDDGVGIFKKIQNELNLPNERQAVLELTKGKFTTAPDRHSGEGIFFTSRMFDEFEILSNGIYFSHRCDAADQWLIDEDKPFPGTTIRMKLQNHTDRSIEEVFNRFSSGEEHAFNRTVVPIKLAQYGDGKLVSRSQAKRLLVRFDRFKTIVLDFEDVSSVGQAFADEIFRVFQKQHLHIDLSFVNASQRVEKMIRRAKSHT